MLECLSQPFKAWRMLEVNDKEEKSAFCIYLPNKDTQSFVQLHKNL